MNHYIGVVTSVERKQGAKKPYYAMALTVSNTGEVIRLNSFDNKVMEYINKKVEFTTEPNGQYTNLKSINPLPESQQTAVSSNTASPAAVAPSAPVSRPYTGAVESDARQENINRQSALNAAVQLVSAQLATGISPLGTKVVTGKSKDAAEKAAVDPMVVLEVVKQTAKAIKWFVQKGDWTFEDVNQAVKDSAAEEDIPF